MTKTRRAGFSKKRRRGGRKTVKRKRRSRVTKGAGNFQLKGARELTNNLTNLITYPIFWKRITFFGGRRRSRGTRRRG